MTEPTTNTEMYNLADYPPGLVAIPATDWMYTRSVGAFLALLPALPPRSTLDINPQSSSPAANRNFLIERFLARSDFEWILFVDSDMTPVPATVARLLSHNVDVVGALCFMRSGEYLGACNTLPGEEIDAFTGLHEVASVGAACLLVRRKVIEAMTAPYFEHSAPGMGEDVSFCMKARQLGFPVYLDTNLIVGHLHVLPVDEQNVLMLRQQPRVQELRKIRANETNSAHMNLHRRVMEERFAAPRFDENGVRV